MNRAHEYSKPYNLNPASQTLSCKLLPHLSFRGSRENKFDRSLCFSSLCLSLPVCLSLPHTHSLSLLLALSRSLSSIARSLSISHLALRRLHPLCRLHTLLSTPETVYPANCRVGSSHAGSAGVGARPRMQSLHPGFKS